MSCVIAKTRGTNWRFCAIDAETGEVLAEQVNLHSLLWSLSRRGYHTRSFQLLRPVAL